DLGIGITTSNVIALNSTHLTAQVVIAATAALGTRTLTVTSGAEIVSLPNAFAVEVPSSPPINQPPIVSAGINQTITLPNAASLSGMVSDDGLPSGGTLTIGWSKVSGPGNVSFTSLNTVATTATFSGPGTYVLRLTASDSQLSASSDLT